LVGERKAQVAMPKVRKGKKRINGVYKRRSCCFVFSLQTGVILMVICDFFMIFYFIVVL
jgi:hypothetical protein